MKATAEIQVVPLGVGVSVRKEVMRAHELPTPESYALLIALSVVGWLGTRLVLHVEDWASFADPYEAYLNACTFPAFVAPIAAPIELPDIVRVLDFASATPTLGVLLPREVPLSPVVRVVIVASLLLTGVTGASRLRARKRW